MNRHTQAYKRAKDEWRRRFQRGQREQQKIERRNAPNRIVERYQNVQFHHTHITAGKRAQRQIGEDYIAEL